MAEDNSKKYLETNGWAGQRFEERLQIITKAWPQKWHDPQEHTQKLLASYASGYFDSRKAREHPINLTDRGVSTIVPFLVEGNPKLLVESIVPNMRPSARRTQLALNFLIKKMNLAENVFIPAATMSMFGGVATRTFSEYDRIVNLDDEEIKIGTPKVILIDPADYIGDPAAKTRADFVIEGDIYRLPTEYAKDIFDNTDEIKPSGKLISKFSAEKISTHDFNWNKLNLRDYSVFIDLYIKDEGIIITIMPYGNKPVRLRTIDYDGPGDGPYDYLGYKYFPGCPIPIPPAWAWNDLDYSMNVLARTAREQAESQKNVVAAEPAAKEAAKKILKASNMDVVIGKNMDKVKVLSFGGVNPDNYNWMAFAETEFTKTGVNPDVLGGRGAQAPTLGQEQLIYRNASRIINNMYNRFENFMTNVINKLAYYVWTDPTVYIPVISQVPGLGEVPIIFSQADKVGDFYDFIFNLKPYSSQRTSPELLYQKLIQFMGSWVLPTAQIAAAQGAQLDIVTATQILADYAGFDNFDQFYKSVVPQDPGPVPYALQPTAGQRPKPGKAAGQTNDSLGASQPSREANSQQASNRANEKGVTI